MKFALELFFSEKSFSFNHIISFSMYNHNMVAILLNSSNSLVLLVQVAVLFERIGFIQ